MKKIILTTIVMLFVLLQTKAQQVYQATDAYGYISVNTTVLQTNETFLKNTYAFPGNNPDKDYDLYLRRSKNYRIVGWATLGGGLVLGSAGLLVATNSSTTDYNSELRAERTHRALFIGSAVAGIVSIPFMIMASSYKEKARLEIKNQKTGFGVPPHVSKDITGISLTIPIGK
jgi:hypothetical protein